MKYFVTTVKQYFTLMLNITLWYWAIVKVALDQRASLKRERGESYVYILPYDTLVRPSCYCSANFKAGSQHAREAISGEGVILGGHGSCTTPNSTGHQVKHEAG